MDNMKEKLLETVKEYHSQHCDSDGSFKRRNLSKEDTIGIQEIKKAIGENYAYGM